MKAQFICRIAGKVKLKKEDMNVVIVPIDELSEEDQQWLQERASGKLVSESHEDPSVSTRIGPPPLGDQGIKDTEKKRVTRKAKVRAGEKAVKDATEGKNQELPWMETVGGG